MSTITEQCKTVTGLASFAKAIGRRITQDGETFMFAPVGCEAHQIDGLRKKGLYVLTETVTGLEGLGWRKGR